MAAHQFREMIVVSNDTQDDLQEGFEVAPLPPLAPDGAVTISPLRKLPTVAPRLCEAGPCVHYHCFEIQLDAARAIANELGENGTLIGEAPPQSFHTQTHHYCYPTTGVETKLGDLPVLKCNLWTPITLAEHNARNTRETEFYSTTNGQGFLHEVAAFQDGQAALVADVYDELPPNTLPPELSTEGDTNP